MTTDRRYKLEHMGDSFVRWILNVTGSKEGTMKTDCRYKLEHMGDSFVGLIQSVIHSAVDSAANVADSAETWKIKGKQKKKVMEIGWHSVRLWRNDPDIFDGDEEIQVAFKSYDELQDAIDQFVKAREERDARRKKKVSAEPVAAEPVPEASL